MAHDTATTPVAPAAPATAAAATNHRLMIADPGPLGLAAFACTTFVLSVINAGLMPVGIKPVVFGLALFYGGIVQVLAGLMEFFKENTFGAVAFCSYGAFWMAFWYLSTNTTFAATVPASDRSHAVGLFLLGWTIFTAYMLVAVMRVNGGLTFTFVVLLGAFVFLTLGDLMINETFTKVGGYFGLLAALGAWYCSFAAVINSTAKRTVLSVFPRA